MHKANITIQDILIQCLLDSLNGEKFQGFKLTIAKQLDDETDSNAYDVLTENCNCIEQSEGNKANSATSRCTHTNNSSTQGGSESCHRCSRSSHFQDSCVANSHVGGNSLDPSTKGIQGTQSNVGKGRGKGKVRDNGRGKGRGHGNNNTNVGGGIFSDILSGVKASHLDKFDFGSD